MYKYTGIFCIIVIKILVANSDEDEYDSGLWLAASKDLENESDDLRDDLCEMSTMLGVDCGEELIEDMRTFFINTENIKKTAKLYDLFALNLINKGLVACLKDVVKVVASKATSPLEGVKCIFQPLIDLVKVSLRLTLDSVMILRHMHHETKECLVKQPMIKVTCLITLHTKTIAKTVKALLKLLRTVTKATMYISGGFTATLVKCAMSNSSKGFIEMSTNAAKFSKCVFCAFTQRCSDSN